MASSFECPEASATPVSLQIDLALLPGLSALFLAFGHFRAGNLGKAKLKSELENSSAKLENVRPGLKLKVSEINSEQFHERFQAITSMENFDQVLSMHRTVLSRLDEYDRNQKNASSFDVEPINASLGGLMENFTNTARERFGGCHQWSNALQAAWHRRTEVFHDLRENLQILTKAARRMAREVDVLAQQKPPGFESYFAIETEYQLGLTKMFALKWQELFEEFYQRLTPPPVSSSSANLAF